jgi:uncharacterized protein (DUF1778 family)
VIAIKNAEKKLVMVRLSEEEHQFFKEKAEAELRSTSNYIVVAALRGARGAP